MAFVGGIGRTCYSENIVEKHHQYKVKKSECCSVKQKGKFDLLKERIRQFNIWFVHNENQKDAHRFKVRSERSQTYFNEARIKFLCCLYVVDALIWTIGGLFTLCSTVAGIGKDTVFYKHRDLYKILGPSLILCAVIGLLVATGAKHKLLKHHRKINRKFYIVNKNKGKLSVNSSKSQLQCCMDMNDSCRAQSFHDSEMSAFLQMNEEYVAQKSTIEDRNPIRQVELQRM